MAANTLKTLDLGYISRVSMNTPEKSSEILIPGPLTYITIHIEYCLGRPTSFKLRPDDKALGISREEIIKGVVVDMNTRVYKVEEETMTDASPYENHRTGGVILLNRGPTTGKYGTHMRELGDLILHTGYYNEQTRQMHFGLDS